jgi:hypothetical protein
MDRIPSLRVGAVTVASTVALLLTCAPAAHAAACNINKVSTADPGTALFDTGGYEWDVTPTPAVISRNLTFATLRDGGSNGPGGNPPSARLQSDSYDSWGALFVGPGGDGSLGNLYYQSDNNACSFEDGNRELVFPIVNLNGLEVQRKLFVSSTDLPGARLLELVLNAGAGAVTTSVQVGDTGSSNHLGDLGSDNTTAVRRDSDGNGAIGSGDLWVVTTDNPTTDTDLALAHVFDGAGGADRVDFAVLNGTDATPQDNLAYRWDNVTIAPGQTAAFISYEIQQGVVGAAAATEVANAASQAQGYEALPFGQIYAGMSDAEIAAVRNWPKPSPTVSIGAVSGAADNAPVKFSSAVAASTTAGICGGVVSLDWDFGDGSKATGSSASHQFKAETYDVKLTAVNSCGGSASATSKVSVADKTAPTVSETIKKRLKLKTLLRRGLLVRLRSSEDSRASLTGRISSSLAKKVSLSRVSRTVLRKSARLSATNSRKLRLKPKKKAARALKKLVRRAGRKGVRVTVKTVVRDSANNKRTVRKRIRVKR